MVTLFFLIYQLNFMVIGEFYYFFILNHVFKN